MSSFELQQQYYRQLVGKHPNWDLQHIFADEGISGTSLKNRDEFNDMIARCFAGEFDLIVTKSVTKQLYETWKLETDCRYRSTGILVQSDKKVMLLFNFQKAETWRGTSLVKENGK